MTEEFEGRDLSGAVFWGVDLSRARLRDVDLTGVAISHARVVDVDIDAYIERVTINGVDVTDFVNEHDPWFPLRSVLRPPEPAQLGWSWAALDDAWSDAVARATALDGGRLHERVGGEWSFVETVRHLVMVLDKWFCLPVLGETSFAALALPNTGSIDFPWPGLDRAADPSLDDALAAWRARWQRVGEHIGAMTGADLDRQVEVLENGTATVGDCVFTVFEEHFQHLRYTTRDLALLD